MRDLQAKATYPGIDLVRLCAAMMVVLYHLAFWWWLNAPIAQFSLIEPVVSGWWVGVEIFFVISGFVIAFSVQNKDVATFAWGRALRLYPAAWLCASVTMLAAPSPVLSYFGSITLFPLGPWVSGVYWTLGIEIAFYALAAVAVWRSWPMRVLGLCLCTYSCLFYSLKIMNKIAGGPFDFTKLENQAGYLSLSHFGIYFGLGILLFEKKHRSALIFGIAALGAVVWRAHAVGHGTISAPMTWLVAVTLIYLAGRKPAHVHPFVRTLGLMTYPLYLVHSEVGHAVMLAIANPIIGLITALTVVLGASWLVVVIEPSLRKAMKVQGARIHAVLRPNGRLVDISASGR